MRGKHYLAVVVIDAHGLSLHQQTVDSSRVHPQVVITGQARAEARSRNPTIPIAPPDGPGISLPARRRLNLYFPSVR
jgi:hypothetical protein